MSQKIECPSCAMEIDQSEKVCPICGNKMESYSPYLKWVALLLASVMLFYLIF